MGATKDPSLKQTICFHLKHHDLSCRGFQIVASNFQRTIVSNILGITSGMACDSNARCSNSGDCAHYVLNRCRLGKDVDIPHDGSLVPQDGPRHGNSPSDIFRHSQTAVQQGYFRFNSWKRKFSSGCRCQSTYESFDWIGSVHRRGRCCDSRW